MYRAVDAKCRRVRRISNEGSREGNDRDDTNASEGDTGANCFDHAGSSIGEVGII